MNDMRLGYNPIQSAGYNQPIQHTGYNQSLPNYNMPEPSSNMFMQMKILNLLNKKDNKEGDGGSFFFHSNTFLFTDPNYRHNIFN